MKLEIDTERDSRATLRGVLRMLQAILGEEGQTFSNRPLDRPKHRNIFEDSSPSVSMYGDSSEETPQEYSASSAEASNSGGGLFNMFGSPDSGTSSAAKPTTSEIREEEPEDEQPEIQIY